VKKEQQDQLNPERLRFTQSEMRTYMRCKRKWFLGYYSRLGTREPDFGKATAIGTRVHNALQRVYDPEAQAWTVEEVISEMQAAIEADVEKLPAFEDAIRKDGDISKIMIEGYLNWLEEEGKDAHLRTLSSEDAVEVAIGEWDPNEVTLLGKLDARVYDELQQSRWALEHKTVGDLKSALPLLQIDFQLLTEHLIEFLDMMERGKTKEEAELERVDGVLYNMLRKVKRTKTAKPPFYGREEVRHNIDELRSHYWHVASIVTDILNLRARLDAGESHHTATPPNPTKDCSWDCPFLRVCGMHDDGSDLAAALDDLYEKVDPLARYSPELKKEESTHGITPADPDQ
jgi:predicted RNase H-like HicB family nuclease